MLFPVCASSVTVFALFVPLQIVTSYPVVNKSALIFIVLLLAVVTRYPESRASLQVKV